MAFLTDSLSVRALFEFRENLELGDGLFQEITGINVKDLIAYRRGRLAQKPIISKAAEERIERCRKALVLALELCGDDDRALDWLYADSPAFGGKSPIDLTVTDEGMEKIQGFIERMRAAVASPKTAAPAANEPATRGTISGPAPTSAPEPKAAEAARTPAPRPAPPAEVKKSASIPAPEVARPAATGSYTPSGMARSRQVATVDKVAEIALPAVPPIEVQPPAAEVRNGRESPPPAPEVRPASSPKEKPASKSAKPATRSKAKTPSAAESAETSEPTPPANRESKLSAPPPPGVDPTKRVFRLKEPLTRLREKKPDLTLKEISNLMVKRGLTQFKVQTHASRLSKSYTWATWPEVVHLADVLEGDPYELGSVRNE